MNQKQSQLLENLNQWAREDVCVAFSGGVDSSLLLHLAVQAANQHGTKVYAATFQTELHPQADLDIAKKVAADAGAIHVIMEVNEFEDDRILENPVNRCYLCKKLLFTNLLNFAKEKGIHTVYDGTNADDLKVYRPGLQAVKEMGVYSPLAMAGLTKEEVRSWAEECGISVSRRPSAPCLATRLPYGTRIEKSVLERIDAGEEYLKTLGFPNVRIRQHGDISRIEVEKKDFPAILERGDQIVAQLKALGLRYITLDLQGFRSGSMDEYL